MDAAPAGSEPAGTEPVDAGPEGTESAGTGPASPERARPEAAGTGPEDTESERGGTAAASPAEGRGDGAADDGTGGSTDADRNAAVADSPVPDEQRAGTDPESAATAAPGGAIGDDADAADTSGDADAANTSGEPSTSEAPAAGQAPDASQDPDASQAPDAGQEPAASDRERDGVDQDAVPSQERPATNQGPAADDPAAYEGPDGEPITREGAAKDPGANQEPSATGDPDASGHAGTEDVDGGDAGTAAAAGPGTEGESGTEHAAAGSAPSRAEQVPAEHTTGTSDRATSADTTDAPYGDTPPAGTAGSGTEQGSWPSWPAQHAGDAEPPSRAGDAPSVPERPEPTAPATEDAASGSTAEAAAASGTPTADHEARRTATEEAAGPAPSPDSTGQPAPEDPAAASTSTPEDRATATPAEPPAAASTQPTPPETTDQVPPRDATPAEPPAAASTQATPHDAHRPDDPPTQVIPAVPVADPPTQVIPAVPSTQRPDEPPTQAIPAGRQPYAEPPTQAIPAPAERVPEEPPTVRLPGRPPVPPGPPVPAQPVPPRRRLGRHRILVGGLAALAVLVLVAGGLAVFRPGPVERLFAGGAAPSPSASSAAPQPVLSPASGAPAPTPAGVAKALGPTLTDPRLGTRTAVSVVDVATNSTLYGRTPDARELPASVTKLVTASAVLTERGPTYRLTTRVVAGQKPGEVVLVGGGDPTLATNGHSVYPQAARLDKLAAQVKRALHGRKPTRVLVDSSLFAGAGTGPGWDSDIVPEGDAAPIRPVMLNAGRTDPNGATATRTTEPDLAAGRKLAQLIGAPVDTVTHGTAPSGARRLGAVQSPPLLHLIELMLQRSDNVIAEAMARQVAIAEHRPATFAGGAAATTAVLKRLGLDTSGLRLADGSGLSRKDRISPKFLTSLLTLITDGKHPKLWPVWTGMPVAGYTGTLANRYALASDAKGAGMIRAKTGSLSGTSTLAGLAMDSDGRVLAFAMMAEGVTDWTGAEAALDKAATTLVGCGCR